MGMNKYFVLLYGVFIGLIIAGLILLIDSPPKGDPITLLPPPTPSPIKVFISGAVQNPGVYQIEPQSRLEDLLEKAGGSLLADMSQYNLAAKLYDGEHIHLEIPSETSRYKEVIPESKVNINSADLQLLMTLPGIGETKAAAIIHYREDLGFFERIEDILNVPGIGDYVFAQIKDLIVTNQINE